MPVPRPASHLTVLGSGSKGNAFVIAHGDELLLIDAGFSAREVERRMSAADLDPRQIKAIALTHEHGDHAGGATRLAARLDVPLLASAGTWRGVGGDSDPCDFLSLGSRDARQVGAFAVTACPTSHDAAEPVAIAVTLPDGLSIGVAYDLGRPTQAVRYFLRERHCLILEANHDEMLLRTSGYPIVVQQRIAGPGGHLSNFDAARLLVDVHHDGLATVVLAHLSQRCNRPERAREVVGASLDAAGFQGALVVAEQAGPMATIALHPPVQQSLFG